MEIYTFDKSLQERLVELSEILTNREVIVPASQIQTEWSYHIELVIEPIGWQALWKIPRLVCEDFQIHYPTIVLVEVERVDFGSLSALVKITAVQDEIHLPEKYDVPLVELYPTLNQKNAALDMVGTASCIDQLRFFYSYLWRPWDIDDDDNIDWVALHLETRIRLFFDMKRGIVSKETSDVIRSLVREGREVQQKISRLEESALDEEEDLDSQVDEGKACQLMKLHFRLQQIKTEMEVLENPAMREVLVKNKISSISNGKIKDEENKEKQTEGYLVWLGGSIEELRETINKAQNVLPEELFLKVSTCLQEILYTCDAGSIIALGKGNHEIRGAGNLEDGGIIKGINNFEETIVSGKEIDTAPSLLDFSGSEVTLENISIDVGELQAAVIVRSGTTKMLNCKVYSLNQSMVKLGIVILPGAKLIVENAIFDGLGTAIVIYAHGEAVMKNCSFKNCAEGLQLHDKVKLTAQNCCLEYFKEYAIRMETQKYLQGEENKYGGVELLQDMPNIFLQDCKFENNGKGNVALKSAITGPIITSK